MVQCIYLCIKECIQNTLLFKIYFTKHYMKNKHVVSWLRTEDIFRNNKNHMKIHQDKNPDFNRLIFEPFIAAIQYGIPYILFLNSLFC